MIINDINIDIEYKNIKNLHLAVYPPDGRVHISAPKGYPEEHIRLYILKKWQWITKKQEELTNYNIQPERKYVSGECHYFKGQRYRLRVLYFNGRENVQHVEIDGDYLKLYVREGATRELKEAILFTWYREEIIPTFQTLISKWEGILSVKLESWEIRQMAARWGSCSKAKKKALFNTQLAKKPVRSIEYVVAHELTHLIEQKHNDRFKLILDMHLPDWETIKKELNEFPI